MRKRNIVFFSSGVTERSGVLMTLVGALESRGYNCSYWRDLFSGAKDSDNIALLPMLIKKIPTFDYAVLICEGHDTTTIMRGGVPESVNTMRDNVLFEIGLCTMALGLSKTILVTNDTVRIPDDLIGLNNQLALKRIIYTKDSDGSVETAAENLADYINKIETASAEIDLYIKGTENVISPVVVGASSSTACGYVNNFVFRTLEHISRGIESGGEFISCGAQDVYMHIVLPEEYDESTASNVRAVQSRYREGIARAARIRPASFRFEKRGEEIHIYDFPTTIGTSYETAKMILEIDADDTEDEAAAGRFTAKELDLFESTVKSLLSESFFRQIISENYSDTDAEETERMKREVMDIVRNRLTVEHMKY